MFIFPSKFEDSVGSRLRRMHAEYFEFANLPGDCTGGNARTYIKVGVVRLMMIRREPCDSRQIS
jgi:hypothetical protein